MKNMHKADEKQEFEKEQEEGDNGCDSQDLSVDVRLFAFCRELIGKDKITIRLKNQMTVRDLRKEILKLYPILPRRVHFAVAVNYEVAHEITPITEKDEVAILPPVSGG